MTGASRRGARLRPRLPASRPRRPPTAPPRAGTGIVPPRALVVSASMGGGHDGAAAELRRRLEGAGYDVEVRDYLDALVGFAGPLLRWLYGWQLRSAPASYSALYWGIGRSRVVRFLAYGVAGSAQRRLARWARAGGGADVVVSTYPLATHALGRLRAKGRLAGPLVAFLTDFGVHPIVVSPHADLTLAPSAQTARDARRLGAGRLVGGRVVVTGPVVPRRFTLAGGPDRALLRTVVRAELAVAPDAHLALVVAGSWGVGDVESTVAELAAGGSVVPVVVCGRNEALRARLAARGAGVVLGWTDRMHELMAASDVLVQNAGGLSCMEAFAVGLPVVSYRCIPGHGGHNAEVMAACGVAPWVREPGRLGGVVLAAAGGADGRQAADRARALFRLDPADEVRDLVSGGAGAAVPVEAGRHRLRALAAAGATVGALAWSGTTGVAIAASHGVGVLHPAGRQSRAVFLLVRPDLRDDLPPATVHQLLDLHASVVLNRRYVQLRPDSVRRLAAAGVPVVLVGSKSFRLARLPGAAGPPPRVDGAAASGPAGHPGRPRRHPYLLVVDRRPDAMDLGLAYLRRDNLVVPRLVIRPGAPPPGLDGGDVALVDGRRADGAALSAELAALLAQVRADHLATSPVTALAGARS